MPFITNDFLLHNEPARILYHDHAKKMPVYDFHSHLDAKDIWENTRFRNLTHAWLSGDHYKWRAMRANGVAEDLITGNATDREKFGAWASTLPSCIGNPLFHWSHLELARIFDKSDTLLSEDTAEDFYSHCNSLLATDDFRVRNLIRKMNVRVLCTTDDPVDSLAYHIKLADEASFPVKVLPTFRPDTSRAVLSPDIFNGWIERLEAAAGIHITGIASFIEAIKARHDFFHDTGCRISDHGMEVPFAERATVKEIGAIFRKARRWTGVSADESAKFQTFVMRECAKMDADRGWTMQLHIGALRNTNTARFRDIGPDSGFDSISDAPIAKPLARFFNSLAVEDKLPRTIVYSLDPSRNETIATMLGNFQESPEHGKMQFGAAWWFNDQKDGIERHIRALASTGLLATFVGMSTDSRSFLSFPRHEYWRRILCNLLGDEVAKGELPNDIPFLGTIVRDICFNNANKYFKIRLGEIGQHIG